MKNSVTVLAATCLSLGMAHGAVADDLEGPVEPIDQDEQSITVQGIRFYATPDTDYEDDLESLSDLKEGDTVEVDFEYRDGKHIAEEIEKEKTDRR